jgi:4-amino-4-deoxy-L-arabinose transferase-like glycosyltransferase
MDAESQPVNFKKSWILAHPRVVIGLILVVCLGPFINKAIHADDVLYVWTGKWIQNHPTDFFGFKVNWWSSAIPMWVANWNPPLMSYFLAGVASLFGWNEIALHLACLAVAFTAAVGIYSLAKMWCERPLLATLVAIFMPAFLVSSSTLMCDVLMLTFWIWALVFWERALGKERSRWQFIGAGVLAGLAVLTKYSAITLLPLLPILSILRTRKLGWWLLGLTVPVFMLAGYELITARMYGTGLLSAAIGHTQHSRGFPGGWEARGIIGLAFAGGCLLPLLFFAPLVWRWRALLAGGVLIFGGLLGTLRLGGDPGLFVPSASSELIRHWDFLLQMVLLSAGGLHLLLLTAAEVWSRRNLISVTLALWILSGLFSAIVLNFTINARGFLLIVPAAAILLVRRLEAAAVAGKVRLLGPLIPAAAITLSLVVADYHLANSARTAAGQIAARYKPADHPLWFEGHWGFQYYLEKLGGQPLDVERSCLQPGDIVAVPWINGSFVTLPGGSVGWVEHLAYQPGSWMNLMGANPYGVAGFFGAGFGPAPFVPGGFQAQDYFVLKVFSRVQFNTQPANPREVQAGQVPSFTNISVSTEVVMTFAVKPEATQQAQLAGQLEAEGRVEEAIQCYRKALDVDSNNPMVLNNLAWILATTSKPELRNGEEAVQLATKAVKLADSRLPNFIETLAAAYAEAGQSSRAIEAANAARVLALLTGQKTYTVSYGN